MSQHNVTHSDIEHLLDSNEKVIWSGQPDLQAMTKTAHRGKHKPWMLQLVAVLLIVWVVYKYLNPTGDGSPMGWMALVVGGSAVGMYFMSVNLGKSLIRWARPLAYAITDKRVLIFRNGAIEKAFTQGDVQQVILIPRKGVEGFSDIVWEKEAWKASGKSGAYPSPLKQEQLETGFKALADGEVVKRILDTWVKQQASVTQQQDDEFIDKKRADSFIEEATDGVANVSGAINYLSPVYGFSLEFPDSWQVTSRYRKLPFGKWGIEREAKWSVPVAKPKWNVIRGQNESKTYVEIQVQKVEPFNTLESLMNTSSIAGMLGSGEVTDHEASITINGIAGFCITRHCGGGASILPAQVQGMLSDWNMRQYILHDGQYQYYIEAMWLDEAPGQQEVCEAVVATLASCRAL